MTTVKKIAGGIGIAVVILGGVFVQCVLPGMRTNSDCNTVLEFMRVTDDMNHPEAASADQANDFIRAVKELADLNENTDIVYGNAPSAAAKLLADIKALGPSVTVDEGDQVLEIGRDADTLVQACQGDVK